MFHEILKKMQCMCGQRHINCWMWHINCLVTKISRYFPCQFCLIISKSFRSTAVITRQTANVKQKPKEKMYQFIIAFHGNPTDTFNTGILEFN